MAQPRFGAADMEEGIEGIIEWQKVNLKEIVQHLKINNQL